MSAIKARAAQTGRGGRLQRSKAACVSCHRSKHRCDGPPGPCHRCKTSGVDCIFTSSAGPTPSSSLATSTLRQHSPAASRARSSTPAAAPPVPDASPPAPQLDPAQALDIVQQLERANVRLEALQSTLDAVLARRPADSPPAACQSASQCGSERSAARESALAADDPAAAGATSAMSALQLAEAGAVSALASAKLSAPSAGQQEDGGVSAGEEMLGMPDWTSARPDALERGIMTVEECQQVFDCYFTNLQPWSALLSTTLDRQPLDVRARSPLLFHVVLLVTLYYQPRTRANLARYCAVSSLVDALLSPQILCPQPSDLSHDFVRAVHLVLMYKPVQYARLEACGVTEASAVESASKMNVCASWMLRLLVSRVSSFIGLPSIADTFTRAVANQHFTPVPDALVSQQRLYLDCVFRELQGALQSGKSANFTPQAATRTTRLFAQLARQPSDVRLAASVELVAHAAEALAAGVPSSATLRTFDATLAAWSAYWRPRLAPHAAPDDPVRWSVFYPYAGFTRLVVRGSVLPAWRARREDAVRAVGPRASLPLLTSDEYEGIAETVAVIEEMVLAVTAEGRALRDGEAGPDAPLPGGPARLAIDPSVAELLKWATDSVTCVMFSYPLILLAKLADEGLVHADLTVPAPGTRPRSPARMAPDDKLCRLLELGADLLEAIAPSPAHPSRGQAAFLRKVRAARLSPAAGGAAALEAPLASGTAAAPAPPATTFPSFAVPVSALPPLPHQYQPPQRALPQQQPQPPQQAHPQGPFAAESPTTAFSPFAPSGASVAESLSLSAAYQPTPVNSPPFPAFDAAMHSLDGLPGLMAIDGWSGGPGGGAAGPSVFEDPLVGWML
ncbi:hypothetical protein JCM3770_004220 [Rhodotorula araucariae]